MKENGWLVKTDENTRTHTGQYNSGQSSSIKHLLLTTFVHNMGTDDGKRRYSMSASTGSCRTFRSFTNSAVILRKSISGSTRCEIWKIVINVLKRNSRFPDFAWSDPCGHRPLVDLSRPAPSAFFSLSRPVVAFSRLLWILSAHPLMEANKCKVWSSSYGISRPAIWLELLLHPCDVLKVFKKLINY